MPAKAAYEKFRNPASRYAIVGVFVAQTPAGVRVAITGAGQGIGLAYAAMARCNWCRLLPHAALFACSREQEPGNRVLFSPPDPR